MSLLKASATAPQADRFVRGQHVLVCDESVPRSNDLEDAVKEATGPARSHVAVLDAVQSSGDHQQCLTLGIFATR
jgi:hypothetical protein